MQACVIFCSLQNLWILLLCTAWFADIDDAFSGWCLVMSNSHPTPGGFISQSLICRASTAPFTPLHKDLLSQQTVGSDGCVWLPAIMSCFSSQFNFSIMWMRGSYLILCPRMLPDTRGHRLRYWEISHCTELWCSKLGRVWEFLSLSKCGSDIIISGFFPWAA